MQGSNDGSTWTDLDRRTGASFGGRFATNVYSFTNTTAYAYYRLNVTANSGDPLIQLSEWNISDGSGTRPPATPMVSVAGPGPVDGANMKPGAGFTGVTALRYSGYAEGRRSLVRDQQAVRRRHPGRAEDPAVLQDLP